MSLLDVEGIELSYGRMPVLFGVSLRVDEHESVALLGTNGAGKSSFLRAIVGLERPSAGKVVFNGEDITGLRADEIVRRGLVLIAGGKAVFPDLTVADNLAVAGMLMRNRPDVLRERRDRVFTTFPRLAERLSQPAGRLSGGEQQQLALAKALLLDPVLLCVDELSLGLAPVVVAELLELVRQIAAQGVAVVLVEQSLNVAAALCPRAVFLEKGEVRFEGPTRDLLDRGDIARAVFLGGAA
jgi:ABC-type branched-subunit amino acid transport system ATPase component